MPAQQKWTPSLDEKLIALWAGNAPIEDIAAALGGEFSARSVASRACNMGLGARAIGGGPRWTEDRVAILKDGWNAGKTANDIVEMLGFLFTRNAVIGKAHRLHLPPRPSPIKFSKKATVVAGNFSKCQFIEGDVSGADTVYCGEPVQEGSPYCSHHHKRCYIPYVKKNPPMALEWAAE